MNDELDFYISMWETFEPFLIDKEKEHAAVLFVSLLDEHGLADGLPDMVNEVDHHLSVAINDWFDVTGDEHNE